MKPLRIIIGVQICFLLFVILYMGRFSLGQRVLSAFQDKQVSDEVNVSSDQRLMERLLRLPKIDTSKLQTKDLIEFAELLERKKAEVSQKIENLDVKEESMQRIQSKIEEDLQKLEDERLFLGQTIQKEKEIKGARLEKLVEVYGKMNPKKAGPMFETLDKDLVVQLFNQLPTKQTQGILESMDPGKSVELTEYYGRVRSMREYDVLRDMGRSLLDEFENCK